MQTTEQMQAEWAAAIAKAGVATEEQMRDGDVPWPKSRDELVAYIDTLTERPHDYGTCVYAMSMAATAAFNYVASKLGVTGFQASAAAMDILRRTCGLKNGFRIISYDDLLYPQYWDAERTPIFRAVLREPRNARRFADEAARRLSEDSHASPTVRDHWRWIIGMADTQTEGESDAD